MELIEEKSNQTNITRIYRVDDVSNLEKAVSWICSVIQNKIISPFYISLSDLVNRSDEGSGNAQLGPESTYTDIMNELRHKDVDLISVNALYQDKPIVLGVDLSSFQVFLTARKKRLVDFRSMEEQLNRVSPGKTRPAIIITRSVLPAAARPAAARPAKVELPTDSVLSAGKSRSSIADQYWKRSSFASAKKAANKRNSLKRNRIGVFRGSRDNAVARIKIRENGTGSIKINGCDISDYFRNEAYKQIVRRPLTATGMTRKVDLVCAVSGGSPIGQANAIRQGVSRALVEINPQFSKNLKYSGYLTQNKIKRSTKDKLKGAMHIKTSFKR